MTRVAAKLGDVSPSVGVGVGEITPSNTVPNVYVAVYVGTSGDVAITAQDGSTATFKNCPAGFVIPVAVTLVMATNTTASNLVGIK